MSKSTIRSVACNHRVTLKYLQIPSFFTFFRMNFFRMKLFVSCAFSTPYHSEGISWKVHLYRNVGISWKVLPYRNDGISLKIPLCRSEKIDCFSGKIPLCRIVILYFHLNIVLIYFPDSANFGIMWKKIYIRGHREYNLRHLHNICRFVNHRENSHNHHLYHNFHR